MSIIKIASIADIHFGKNDPEQLYNELVSEFIEPMKLYRPDIIEIAGDTFDKKLIMNSESVLYANKFIDAIYTNFSKNGTVVLLIHGTLSHDNLQIKAYQHYSCDTFRIYNTATSAYIKGINYLILPEEYVTSDDYYGELIKPSVPYDKCVGHGMIDFVSFVKNGMSNSQKVYIWSNKLLNSIVRGITSFGHIHTSQRIKNVMYNGSFSRMNFGEEEPKGFYTIEYNTEKHTSKVVFHENMKAPKYTDVVISTPYENENSVLKYILHMAESNDYIRIIPKIHRDDALYEKIIQLVRTLNNATLLTKFIERDSVTEMEFDDSKKERISKCNLYKDLGFIETTIQYAKNELQITLTKEDIENALSLDLKKG